MGARVLLEGLVARAELNGCAGLVFARVAESGRFSVQLDHSKEAFDLRRENLRLILPDGPPRQRQLQQQQQQQAQAAAGAAAANSSGG